MPPKVSLSTCYRISNLLLFVVVYNGKKLFRYLVLLLQEFSFSVSFWLILICNNSSSSSLYYFLNGSYSRLALVTDWPILQDWVTFPAYIWATTKLKLWNLKHFMEAIILRSCPSLEILLERSKVAHSTTCPKWDSYHCRRIYRWSKRMPSVACQMSLCCSWMA